MEDFLKNNANNPKTVAIGEIGLDYHYNGYSKEKQKEVFVEQMKLAHELNLPICIHSRDATGDLIEILKEMLEYCKRYDVSFSKLVVDLWAYFKKKNK